VPGSGQFKHPSGDTVDWHPGTAGRHLLGLEPEAALFGIIKDRRSAAEVATYLAALALSQGRIADVFDWLQVTLESGQRQLTEYDLAIIISDALNRRPRSLAWMTKNARWPRFSRQPGREETAR
jgi:hypothetical protein